MYLEIKENDNQVLSTYPPQYIGKLCGRDVILPSRLSAAVSPQDCSWDRSPSVQASSARVRTVLTKFRGYREGLKFSSFFL